MVNYRSGVVATMTLGLRRCESHSNLSRLSAPLPEWSTRLVNELYLLPKFAQRTLSRRSKNKIFAGFVRPTAASSPMSCPSLSRPACLRLVRNLAGCLIGIKIQFDYFIVYQVGSRLTEVVRLRSVIFAFKHFNQPKYEDHDQG